MMKENHIQWNQLSAITVMQSFITLSWVIYALYFPELLVDLGYSKALAGKLLIVEHLLEMAIEPTFGLLSDRQNIQMGNRFSYITLGVLLSGSFFLALPIVTFFLSPTSSWRWLLPTLALIWASAMAIFRSPVIALLAQVAPKPQLPIAASYLTLVQRLVSSIRFTAYDVILNLGTLFTFAIGSFSLLIGAALLRKLIPSSLPKIQTKSESNSLIPIDKIILIFTTAIAIALGLRFLFTILPQVFTTYFGADFVSKGMLFFSLSLAFTALPAGQLASRLGTINAIRTVSITTGIGLIFLMKSLTVPVIILVLLIISLSFTGILNTMIPFVLAIVPADRTGFGIGIFFAGFSGGLSFFDFLINTKVELNILLIQAIICFSIINLIVYLSTKSNHKNSV